MNVAINCWLLSASASCGRTSPIDSKLNRPARREKTGIHKMVKSPIMTVIDQALNMRLERDRYVFRQMRSDGAGESEARRTIGLGSMIACTAICYNLSAKSKIGHVSILTALAVESNVTKARGVGMYSFRLADWTFSSSFRSFSS